MTAMPRQSSATAIVFAVKWPAHVPGPGQATRSSSSSAARGPGMASHTSWIVTPPGPARIGPLYRTTAGLSTRASAMSAAGTVLSQPTMHTSASKSCASVISSIESAITSRETSDARIPGVACDWLSDTAIVLKTRPTPPAAVDAFDDAIGELALVEVARHRPRPRRRDADDRTVEARRIDPHRAEVRPCGRARADPLHEVVVHVRPSRRSRPSASRSSSAPGRPLTPTAPTRASPSNTATPPRKNVKNGSKLARSTGSSRTFSASSRVERASLRAAVYAFRCAFRRVSGAAPSIVAAATSSPCVSATKTDNGAGAAATTCSTMRRARSSLMAPFSPISLGH